MRRTLAQIPSLFGRLLVPITIPSGTPIAILEIQRGSGHNQFEVYALVRDCPTVHGLPQSQQHSFTKNDDHFY